MEVLDIDKFIEKYKDKVFPNYSTVDIRPVRVNSTGGGLLNTLELYEFENVFADRLQDLGKLLWYYPEEHGVKAKYPLFRKAVYEKYGIKAVKGFNEETREYEAMAL
jgi:hypothetical protein